MTTPESPLGGQYQAPVANPNQPYLPGQPGPQRPLPGPKGLALAALLVGIAAFLFGLIPVFGAIVGIVAIVLAVLALRGKQPKGLAVTGLVLGAVAVLSSIGVTLGIGAAVDQASNKPAVAVTEEAAPRNDESAAPAAAATTAPEPEETTAPKADVPAVPADFASALIKAGSYAHDMNMSKAGIYDQLTSEYGEKFSAEAAQYAIDNVQADWNANALAKAKSYQADMAMSPEAIRDQLTSSYGEKFTPEEADFAIQHLND
ncbi:Ltp family lipoprotein [Curtobacterium sp. RRHDQ66]|uniref:Ltp family lipoprotein n=1 Tax=Curtobacterium guangdongense TaxID=3413380 RepID=UPI003BF24600